MQMEHLSCKTPEMVRKEFYTRLLAYNLMRTVMFQASVEYGDAPSGISFQATIQHLHNFGFALAYADARILDYLYAVFGFQRAITHPTWTSRTKTQEAKTQELQVSSQTQKTTPNETHCLGGTLMSVPFHLAQFLKVKSTCHDGHF